MLLIGKRVLKSATEKQLKRNISSMTQEDKELLLKDLCARLPYGVICKVVKNDNPWIGDCKLRSYWLDRVTDTCYEIKPYLRPMSSMTDGEIEELSYLVFQQPDLDMVKGWESLLIDAEKLPKLFDWLNAHHFDYRGLIPMGLALEAPEGMYKFDK
jgi:hypothetical protein